MGYNNYIYIYINKKVKVPHKSKAQRGVEVYLYSFLTSAVEGGR
jgi:hypothetical protein